MGNLDVPRGRYVRYQARAGKEHGGWIFTDEIIVE